MIKIQVFSSPKMFLPGPGGRPTGRPDQEPVDRSGRPYVHKTCIRPLGLAGRLCGRPTVASLLSGKDGRPEFGNGQISTVGRSTGWSNLIIIAANGQIPSGGYIYSI